MSEAADNESLIYDWNVVDMEETLSPVTGCILTDETLRDGLQSPSVRTPDLDTRIEILHRMEALGVQQVDIGLPGAGEKAYSDCLRLAKEIADNGMKIVPNCAVRTVIADLEPVVRIREAVGMEVEASAFIGSSPIRQYVEGWGFDKLRDLVREAVSYAVSNSVPVMFVTEDTTRARPAHLSELYSAAATEGARRICIADTVGHTTPAGARKVVTFLKREMAQGGFDVKIDWHGHRDRGLDLANGLAALEAGATGVHGTILGIGERSGNMPLDLFMVNLKLMGLLERDLSGLADYCALVSEATGVEIPVNYPVFGRDAFRTATGVHAAAVIKAKKRGETGLADRVYSSVPAGQFGMKQTIEIGPMSGRSNVQYWLEERGIQPSEEIVDTLYNAAKLSDHTLNEEEAMRIVRGG